MEHQNLEKMSSTALMLPRETEKVVILTPSNGSVGKILIREDTILANLQGCAGCGRAQFNCAGVKNQWSALCWGKEWGRRYYCLLITLSATFVLSLIGTIVFCFTNTINDAVLSSMVIRNNSMAFRMWQRPTVKPLMKVHLFNYTNWEEVRADPSLKLTVEDVGPYVYKQEIERVNIKFEGDQLSFQERNTFTYLPEKSTGKQFDQINVPNLPLLGVVSKVVNLNSLSYFVSSGLNIALTTANHPDAFIKLPVHKFLWGYEDSIIDVAKPYLSLSGQLNFDRFGLLVTKNGTMQDRLTINTGENEKDKMNIIEKFNGQTHLNFWGSNECNSIEASDGSIFPPSLLDRQQVLNVFFPNLCRRLPFEYEKDVETEDGIQLLRYRMPLEVFDDPSRRPAAQCYCDMDTGRCPPRGVINVTACTMGAPALVSFPHFYLGDESLREAVHGLKPDPLQHDSFLDIHPTLGIALNGKSALQINMQVKRTENFAPSAVSFLPNDIILPVAWLDMSVEDLPDNVRSLVYHGTYSTAAVHLSLIASCVVALLVSGICLFVMFVRRRPLKPCATLKKVPVETEMRAPS